MMNNWFVHEKKFIKGKIMNYSNHSKNYWKNSFGFIEPYYANIIKCYQSVIGGY